MTKVKAYQKTMIISKQHSEMFLSKYQAVMAYLNDGKYPQEIKTISSIRSEIYCSLDEITNTLEEPLGKEFINRLKHSIFGKFVYLKKYKDGYVFMHMDTGTYYQVLALTTPLEEMCDEFIVVTTALFPIDNQIICDGLVAFEGIHFGKHHIKTLRDGYWKAKKDNTLIKNIKLDS